MALSVEENELITHVGPGTPCGEMMRRYWHPIGLSAELKVGRFAVACWAKTWSFFAMIRAGSDFSRCAAPIAARHWNSAISKTAVCAAAITAGSLTSRERSCRCPANRRRARSKIVYARRLTRRRRRPELFSPTSARSLRRSCRAGMF